MATLDTYRQAPWLACAGGQLNFGAALEVKDEMSARKDGFNEAVDRATKAEAACAEMRAALAGLMNTDPGIIPSVRQRYQVSKEDEGRARRALSSDAGRGWVSPEEHGRLKEWAKRARMFTENSQQNYSVICVDSEDEMAPRDGCECGACLTMRDGHALLAEAKALGLE